LQRGRHDEEITFLWIGTSSSTIQPMPDCFANCISAGGENGQTESDDGEQERGSQDMAPGFTDGRRQPVLPLRHLQSPVENRDQEHIHRNLTEQHRRAGHDRHQHHDQADGGNDEDAHCAALPAYITEIRNIQVIEP